jgi:membrane protein YdbS with pleckstrin-like domain
MSNSSSSGSGGISFVGLLQILFIGLKLTNFIAWPWWQVMLPTIISFFIFIVCLIIVAIILFFKDK